MRDKSGELSPSDIEERRATVRRLANSTRFVIRIIAGGLALLFAFLSLGENWLHIGIESVNSDFLYKFGLLVYYTSWVLGSQFDVDIEESVFSVDQLDGNIGVKLFFQIAIFSILSVVLLALHVFGYHLLFAASLAIFVLVNFWGWVSICKRIESPIKSSIELYEVNNDRWAIAKLRYVDEYMRGNWQRSRFSWMAIVVVVLCAVTYLVPTFKLPEYFSSTLFNGASVGKFFEILPAIVFVAFVATSTFWMWLKRAEATVQLRVIDKLRKNHALDSLSLK